MNKQDAVALGVTVGVVVFMATGMTGCTEKTLAPGPAGKIVEKAMDDDSGEFFITVKTEDGKKVQFQVPGSHYGRCYRGSAYPKCLEYTDRNS